MYKKCAVILAGGRGTRLRPYTIAIPKPLVPIGDYPILEIIIRRLAEQNFTRIIITVNHQAELIQAYFGNGEKWGIEIEYALESKPLGTMGPLKNISDLPDQFLVTNGDVLTNLDYSQFLESHTKKGAIFTISAFERYNMIDYGVLHVDQQGFLVGFEEKPSLPYMVSMGVYAISREVLQYIPQDKLFGFDDLMHCLLRQNKQVNVELFDGYWLDIGRPSDYEQAINDFEEKRGLFLT